MIGNPSGTNLTSNSFMVSSRTTNNNFTYLMQGRIAGAILGGLTYIPEQYKGTNAKLVEIKIMHSGYSRNSKGQPVLIFEYSGSSVLSVWDVANAFGKGELLNPNRPMNRTEAIAKLKESKDLLDLGMIKQDEYDKLKTQLTAIITQNK